MKRHLAAVCVTMLCASAALVVQERVSKPKARDFAGLLTEAKTAFDGKRFGAALGHLRDAVAIASKEQRKAILAAFPAPPTDWTFEAPEQDDQVSGALAGIAMAAGTSIEGTYQSPDGDASMRVAVLADSPLTKMLAMTMSNPAALEKGSELVRYGKHTAVLRTRTKGSNYELQILIDDDLVTVDVEGAREDLLFGVWNQAAVDKLAAALVL